ncbi:MAG: hypothetical protein IPL61_10010 [Myxococcales bacterium]|nr:hypothetical protein [Myxococcales bacterium]
MPTLRCEIRHPSPAHGWLKWSLALVVIAGGMVDALWLVPAQRESARRCHRAERVETTPAPTPTPRPRVTRVDNVLLGAPR